MLESKKTLKIARLIRVSQKLRTTLMVEDAKKEKRKLEN